MKEITITLGSVKREIILLLKTIEFLKTIEKRFDDPINSYQYIVYNTIISLVQLYEQRNNEE
jgi:hypothetical protein